MTINNLDTNEVIVSRLLPMIYDSKEINSSTVRLAWRIMARNVPVGRSDVWFGTVIGCRISGL